MKNLFKKNQLMITALAIMIAIAGYLQFADTKDLKGYETAEGEVVENYTAEGIGQTREDDILLGTLNDIESLDYEGDEYAANYSSEDMFASSDSYSSEDVFANSDSYSSEDVFASSELVNGDYEDYESFDDSIPGEAIFTSSAAVTVLADAKLLKEQTRATNKDTLLNIINSEGLTDAQKQAAVDSMVKMTEYAELESSIEILLSAKGFLDAVVSVGGDSVDVVVNAIDLSDAQRAQITDIVMRKTNYAADKIVISAIVE